MIEGSKWYFETGDGFFIPVKGQDIDGGDDNPLAQARHILKTFGGALQSEFSTTWATMEAKVTAIKSRVWVREPTTAIEYALSLLEQVRMEMYVNADQKLSVVSLWWEDMVAAPSFKIRNWDLEQGSLSISIDEKNNFNRVQGAFGFDPVTDENAFLTRMYRNSAAIAQVGKSVSKRVLFPNLYVGAQVDTQLQEILRLASASPEFVDCTVTWRSLLQDVGGWVTLSVDFGGAKFVGVPCLIRSLGYDPAGVKLPLRLWSFQQTPFPGWSGQGSGIVGGSSATITGE
jgi:hypothetical protein